jgi:geranylgeranyl diphosphate synthase type I
VNEHLANFFADKRAHVAALSPSASELLDGVSDLTMRGGKRLRCLVLYAGFRAAGGASDPGKVLDLAAAIELLQSYFLIQDDWMDDDAERRGGPAVHAAFGARRGDAKLGASLAILASDLAAGFAFELLHRGATATTGTRTRAVLDTFTQMHTEVVCGQQLDLLEHLEVARTHDLKTGSYTVRGPLRLGALMGSADPTQLDALERFGRPIGVAFQLRDDLLGTFGDPRLTGKPAGHDLREGKNTLLVSEARKLLDPTSWARVEVVLGSSTASAEALEVATGLLESSGARARVEAHLAALVAEAEQALTAAPLAPEGVDMLRQLLRKLVLRDR